MGGSNEIHATTIVAVRRENRTCIAGDGQVSLGDTVMKQGARKVRRLHHDKVLAGFAGASADAFTLFERFEQKLEEHRGQLRRAAVELAKDWRSDRALRRLEALLLVADESEILVVSGTGDVIEPDPMEGHVPVAYIVTSRDFDRGATIRELRKELAANHIPKSFVVLREIPRTGSGKVDRRALDVLVGSMEDE